MPVLASLILMQTAATPLPAADPPKSWSILNADPCPRTEGADILVCARRAADDRLPLPDERPPVGPLASNPYLTGEGALGAAAAPCVARLEGCQVGFNIFGPGVAAARLLAKLIDPTDDCCAPGEEGDPIALVRDVVAEVKRPRASKAEKARRVPIPLD
ncbi:hypothetical protein [uncultured Sphingomonas sp.]|uniref:hypothetical protein n=1 Tax=uncultured Sphingomonas sp. TaxID=158754 RepID=UPI00261FCDED|nr:hypothetical protein [uncultured Sphingomonas sp.]